jgi:hypothetical protein
MPKNPPESPFTKGDSKGKKSQANDIDKKSTERLSMAEIKSTLDLIMEKTRNMTMSDEEKKALQQKELHGKVKGWVQRYADGQIGIETIREYLEEHKKDRQTIIAFFKEEGLKRIEPDADNKRMFQLLQDVAGEDVQPIARRIDAFRDDQKKQVAIHVKKMLQVLADDGIYGSAVVPNLDKDQAWQDWLAAAQASFNRSKDTETSNP